MKIYLWSCKHVCFCIMEQGSFPDFQPVEDCVSLVTSQLGLDLPSFLCWCEFSWNIPKDIFKDHKSYPSNIFKKCMLYENVYLSIKMLLNVFYKMSFSVTHKIIDIPVSLVYHIDSCFFCKKPGLKITMLFLHSGIKPPTYFWNAFICNLVLIFLKMWLMMVA